MSWHRHAHRSGTTRRAAAALFAVGLLAFASIAAASAQTVERAKLTAAERAFSRSYEALVPTLNRASAAVIHDVDHASKDTDAQVARIFGAVARQWATATRPLHALNAPPQEATVFATMTRLARSVEGDLGALSQAGSTHNVNEGSSASRQLARDFDALGVAINQMKRKLGLL